MDKQGLKDYLNGYIKLNSRLVYGPKSKSKPKRKSQLVHASNIWGKLGKVKDAHKLDALMALGEKYREYLDGQNALAGWSDQVIDERVRLLNDYYAFYGGNGVYDYDSLFSSQGKLRPTILEEFVYLLFKDYVKHIKDVCHDDKNKIALGSAQAYCNVYFSPASIESFVNDASIRVNEKNQDFVISRIVRFEVEDFGPVVTDVPILAIEVKTYLDKTMLESVISTAEKLKRGNPQSHTVVVVETYQVDLDVDISYTDIDQIYVLRKCTKDEPGHPIDADVVKRLFQDAQKSIEGKWADTKNKLLTDGLIR